MNIELQSVGVLTGNATGREPLFNTDAFPPEDRPDIRVHVSGKAFVFPGDSYPATAVTWLANGLFPMADPKLPLLTASCYHFWGYLYALFRLIFDPVSAKNVEDCCGDCVLSGGRSPS